MSDMPDLGELADAITEATRAAVTALFSEHPGTYYYLALITTGEAHAPFLTAWSHEALAAAAESEEDREMIKWSYADSPIDIYGEEHFDRVRELFDRRPQIGDDMSDDDWAAEHDLRLSAMETALRRLDDEGLFDEGERRLGLVVNVEVMPPDPTNTERARRLNPPAALTRWLEEVAE